jgi:glycerate 2-kinase
MKVLRAPYTNRGRLARRSLSCQYLIALASSSGAFQICDTSRFRRVSPFSRFQSALAYSTRPEAAARQTLEEEKMTADCRAMIHAAIEAVDPCVAVKNMLTVGADGNMGMLLVGDEQRQYNLHDDYDNVVLVAFGKASSAMAAAVLDRLLEAGAPLIAGLVICKDGHASIADVDYLAANDIQLLEASHPVPDSRSVKASETLLTLVRNAATDRTLVIACISGGGSALFCLPHERLTLDDLQATNTVLLQSGWNIQDINIIRKRLEQGKGGRLAQAAYPGHVLSLILSDVLGDPLDLIASGPTVPDNSTWQDAWNLAQRLTVASLPSSVMQLLRDGANGSPQESQSKKDHPFFEQCHTYLVGNNALAVTAAAEKAQQLGYHPIVLGTQLQGEAGQAANFLVTLAQHARQGPTLFSLATKFPLALLVGGETTVSLPYGSTGKGGRNQELGLAAALLLRNMGQRQVVVASFGTDGTDGPTDAAGAIVDGGTVDRLPGSALDALTLHDAYHYLERKDDRGLSPLLKVRFPYLWHSWDRVQYLTRICCTLLITDGSYRHECGRYIHGVGTR